MSHITHMNVACVQLDWLTNTPSRPAHNFRQVAALLSKCITLAELVELPLLLQTSSTAVRGLIDAKMKEQNLHPTVRFQFVQAQTIIAMAEAGVGAAILPASSLTRATAATARILEITAPSFERKMALITLPNQSLSPAAGRLAEKIIEDVRAASDYGRWQESKRRTKTS
ncbi:MAG: hypothetical protein EOP02_00805 [Proteobacteria bacterium]|nr:MAG: hypothetical protein EOP02_00805 [Pseudomonadota bacterium]